MEHPYLPILLVLILGLGFAGVFLLASSLIGPRKYSAAKQMPYECGHNPVGSARERFDVKFFLVAILFLLFDIEAVFFFPWALLYKEFIQNGMGVFMLIEMGIFMVILTLGLVYIWRKGALEWK